MKCIILSFKNLLTIQEGINRERRIKLKDISKVKEFLQQSMHFYRYFFHSTRRASSYFHFDHPMMTEGVYNLSLPVTVIIALSRGENCCTGC